MTGKSPRKKVDTLYWQGRLRAAQAYLEAAQQAHLLAEEGQNCNPVISQIVLSAIAFGDSLTARRAQVVNQQDHAQGLGDRLGVHISPVVLTPSELAKLSPSDPWWAEVSRDAKVLKGVSPAKEATRCAKAAQPA